MSELPPEAVSPPTRNKRWLFWVGVPLFLLGAAAVGIYVYLEHQADLAIRDAIAETDRLEPNGWQLADIEQQRRDAASKKEDNAAITVGAVHALLPKTWPPQPPAPIQANPGNPGAPGAGDPAGLPPGAMGVPATTWLAQPASFDERINLPLEVQMDAALIAELRAELAKDKIPEAIGLADKLADQKEGHRY